MDQIYLPGKTRKRIQDLIKDNKITQAELAEKIGLSESALSRYLQGKTKKLGDGYLIKIAKALNVSTDFLLGETDIPDRKNYDIEELGLSAKAAKLLYTRKIDSHILNRLLENPHFPKLTTMLSLYQNETVKTGIIANNKHLSSLYTILLDQADAFPESADAAIQAANDIKLVQLPEINADITAIQSIFLRIVKDIKTQAGDVKREDPMASSKIMEQIRQEAMKTQNSSDLRKLSSQILTNAVMDQVAMTGLSEKSLQGLSVAFKQVLDELQGQVHDE